MQREREPQAAKAVLMVRPAAFASNPETLASNAFQTEAVASEAIASHAQTEFDAVAETLMAAGVRVHVFDGQTPRACPDEIFPNNWISSHADGAVVLYPMLSPSRRRERRLEFVEALAREPGYEVTRTIDLTAHETHSRFLEGTGSLVLDRLERIAYACRSPRTHEQVIAEFTEQLGYTPVLFDALDRRGEPIYHTNVMLSVGTRFAVVCAAAIDDITAREAIVKQIEGSGRSVIEITLDQMHAFAANVLELDGRDGTIIALSEQALAALGDSQIGQLASYGELVTAAIPTIETYGGGGLRCMLTEIHLPDNGACSTATTAENGGQVGRIGQGP